MDHDSFGMHHVHRRKRQSGTLEPFPHPDPYKRFLDKMIYVVGVAGPVMTIPQLYLIFAHESAAGTSLVTWSAYTVMSVFWLLYGVAHKEKPIILSNTLWLLVNGLVTFGVFMYS